MKKAAALLAVLILLILNIPNMNAQSQKSDTELDIKQKALVTISSYAATGNLPPLKHALSQGLDTGLTINEIKEALVHLYAYCGFPRSLNGLNTFISVLDERKAAGKHDAEGHTATPVTNSDNKYNTGKQTLEALTGKPEAEPKTGANAFAPVIDIFLKEHLFADIFSRDVLTYAQRELITITALGTMPGLQAQLASHLGIGLNVGLSEMQLKQIFALIESHTGKQQANAGRETLGKVIASRNGRN